MFIRHAWARAWPLAALSLATLLAGCGKGHVALPFSSKKPAVIGFYVGGSSGPSSSKTALKSHPNDVHIVSPYWYRLGTSGRIDLNQAEASLVAWAHRQKMRVWPLVGNTGSTELASSKARTTAIKTLSTKAKAQGYDGLFVDFELIPPTQKQHLSAFVSELSSALHKQGKKVGVAVFPKLQVDSSVAGVYDYKALGKSADAVVVMTYDRHQNSGAPGPVAPLSWTQANMRYAAKQIPKSKLYMGVATYGYDWTGSGSATTVTTAEALATAKKYGATVKWSKSAQEPYYTYTKNGTKHTVWFEDSASFAQKLAFVKKEGFAGVAVWRLGGEQPKFWKVLGSGGSISA